MRLLSLWLRTLASWLETPEAGLFSCGFGCEGKLTPDPKRSLYECEVCDRRWVRDVGAFPTLSLIPSPTRDEA